METITKFDIKEIQWAGKTFLTKRAKLSFDKLTAFFGASYGALYQALAKSGIKATEPPFAIYHSIDEKKMETDLSAAVAVHDGIKAIEGFQKMTIPASKALLLTYYGSYENMAPAYAALEEYMAEHKFQKAWTLEEYFSDPAVEKDPAKWKTNIYFIVK